MQLWNTRARAKEKFEAGPLVRLYVCGITPYDTTHLGHARTYLTFDVLIREIERLGHEVRYTQNVTDVDDPLFERAQRDGIPTAELARVWTRRFQDDMAALRIRPPDFYPRASNEVPTMLEIIGTLVERGHAYTRDGRVYYRVRSFPDYGKLSHLGREEMIVEARDHGEDPADPRKEDSLDFLLWKPSLPGEGSWPSPWGEGRPGWHIECSAMALRYLGPALDVHGGGTDLIYPHHENEIAQSVAATGESPFARYWVHVGMARLGGVKMSKSLGNLVLVRELRRRFDPLVVRHYLLRTHYREFLDYSEDELRDSIEPVERLRRALARADARIDGARLTEASRRFDAALADDLNTPLALDALDEASRLVLAAPAGEGNAAAPPLGEMATRLGLTP